MSYALAHYLPWLLSGLSIVGAWLAGSLHRWTWLLGLFNQALWLVWILYVQEWGFLPLNIWLWVIYTRNHLKWKSLGVIR